MHSPGVIARALRLPFLAASVLPYVLGCALGFPYFNWPRFWLGAATVAATHLAANLINDYADARSGADAKDRTFYGLFGGSKLIQEGVLPGGFYLRLAGALIVAATISVVLLAWLMRTTAVLVYYLIIVFLAASYSERPLRLSYRGLGECVIFILFGPAVVMGGYYLQTGRFPDAHSFLAAVPVGLLTTAILFANEVPDFPEDRDAGKRTWVVRIGPERAHRTYRLLVAGALAGVLLNILLGGFRWWTAAALLLGWPAARAAGILRRHYGDKGKLVESSRLTIVIQTVASLLLIAGVLL